MNSKFLVSGLVGGVVFFFLGWLFYGIVFESTFQQFAGSATGVMKTTDMVWWALIFGNLLWGLFYAYVFSNWANVSSFVGGAKAGATMGFFMSGSYDLINYATSNVMQLGGAFLDIFICMITSAIAGGVIGWMLGRK